MVKMLLIAAYKYQQTKFINFVGSNVYNLEKLGCRKLCNMQ